jgi:hypothetical protein
VTVDEFISKLSHVSPGPPGQWTAYCPVHEGDGQKHKPSLGVGTGNAGEILVHCFVGCGVADIVKAMGLELADLYPTGRSVLIHRPRPCNVIPPWIPADPAWQSLTATARWLLHCFSEEMRDVVDKAGSLGYAPLADTVTDESGLSCRAAELNAAKLSKAGFLVKVAQGGQVAHLPGKRPTGRIYKSNLYGIPGQRGALDAYAVPWNGRAQKLRTSGTRANSSHDCFKKEGSLEEERY